MIKALATIENPDNITVSMELSMTIGEWKKIAAVMAGSEYWPCGRLASMVKSIIQKATNQVSERIESVD